MTYYCKICGHLCEDERTICWNCGNKLEDECWDKIKVNIDKGYK